MSEVDLEHDIPQKPVVVGIVETVESVLELGKVEESERRLHLLAALIGLGWTEDEVRREVRVGRGWKRLRDSQKFQELASYYEHLPERSVEIARKLEAIGAPKAVCKILKSLDSQFESISNKVASEILKDTGVARPPEERPQINIYISQQKLELIRETKKLMLEP